MHLPRKLFYGLVSGWLVFLLLGVFPVLAEPSDPFTGASLSFDAAPEEPESNNVGDWGVAEQRGAATYTYPIEVPPGRNGMAPSLALRYSSHTPLRGGIAVGWTLDIPSIRVDTALGIEDETVYQASLRSVSGRLVQVPDASPYPGAQAYRAEFDNSFTRFFNLTPGRRLTSWIALTSDGVKHYFGNELYSTDDIRWLLTRQVDPFGNTVRYFWARTSTGPYMDYSLERIEYTSNSAAGLSAHAKVEFAYAPLEVCSYSSLPIGASLSPMSTSTVEGARRLTAIRIYVRDEPNGAWRLSREISLDYELRSSVLHYDVLYPDPPPPDIYCTQNPLRYLTQIAVTAYDSERNSLHLPPITFEYNRRTNTLGYCPPFTPCPLDPYTIDTPGYAHYGTSDGTVDGAVGTLLDIDSDGIPDRVSVVQEDAVCTLVWQKGHLGGAFEATERKTPLPTAPWYEEWKEYAEPRPLPKEGCTLNGQVAYRDRLVKGDEVVDVKGIVSYHFMDYTGDGRLDLLTNIWTATGYHDTYVPSMSLSADSAPANADLLPKPTPEPTPDLPPSMTPEGSTQNYIWRVYRNAGDPNAVVSPSSPDSVFSITYMQVVSPRPLPPSVGDDRLDTSVAPNYSIPPLTDMDGDGFLDVVDVTRDHNLLGHGNWTVHLGDGGPDFPLLADAIEWQVPAFDMAIMGNGFAEVISTCGLDYPRTTRTIAGLYDIDGNGLPDLVVQTSDLRLKAYRNIGGGFQDAAIDLGVPQPLERSQMDCLVPSYAQLKDGYRGYLRRMVDLDGDGRLDVISYSGASADARADVFSIGSDGQWRYSSGGITSWIEDLTVSSVPLAELRFGDFDGDGRTDVFSIGTGDQWRYSSGGATSWINLRTSTEPLAYLAFGDFDADGRTDVFYADGRAWYVSYGGISLWQQINVSSMRVPDLAFGDFDGDGDTDVFYADGRAWYVSYNGATPWQQINVSSHSLRTLAFGDFDGDGVTDVFHSSLAGSGWYVSYGGSGPWQQINVSGIQLSDLAFADLNGDGKTDVFNIDSSGQWRYSSGGTTPWIDICLDSPSASLADLRFGYFSDDVSGEHDVYARFNMGDRFGPLVQLPEVWQDAKRLLVAVDGDWRTDIDFVDVTGDGLADLARWNADNSLTYVDSPGLSSAPDLLSAVENGRGLRVEFSYAPTTDPDVVQWTTLLQDGPHLPSVMWVVDEVAVEGGYGTPAMLTRYTYQDPRYLSPSEYTGVSERSHFAGFEGTTRTVYAGDDFVGVIPARRVTRAYAYDDSGAPDGRPVQEWTSWATEGAWRLHEYKEITWQRKPLFFAETFFVHRDTTLTRTCEPEATEAECMVQTSNIHRVQETWVDVAPSKWSSGEIIVDPVTYPPELYVLTAIQEGSGLVENDQDRRIGYEYHIRYGQGDFEAEDYRVLTRQTTLERAYIDGTELAFEERGKTRDQYDPATGLSVRTDVWLDESTCATTERTFDPQTGNLLSETKPEQRAPGGSGNSQVFGYDPQQLFVQETTNELGHQVITRYDVATGILLERQGPNFVTSPPDNVIWERETWRIDGLGRVLEHAISVDDDVVGYELHVVDTVAYFDLEAPNRIHEEHRRDLNGDVWLTTDRTMDGLGRGLSGTVHLDDSPDEVTTYEYDSTGNLSAIHVPDPRTDGAYVSYEYRHDGLGRLTAFIRPDGTGLSITYAGLEKTIQETTADGSGFTKVRVRDTLGRLIELRELGSDIVTAITQYRYDVHDNLTEIIDAEGNLTELDHDWAGNRVSITRGDRVWRYVYDLNGNLVKEISPLPAGQDAVLHTVFFEYDDLDRVTAVHYAAVRPELRYETYLPLVMRGNPTAAGAGSQPGAQTKGAAHGTALPTSEQGTNTVRYFYDDGPNGLGRLSRVELFFGEIQYSYDARGLAIAETRTFALSDVASVSASQTVQRQYNALGLPTLSTWDDGQQWQITYDERGLVDAVEWYDPGAGNWQQVADYERTTAGLPRTRNTSYGQSRQFAYDVLGRLTLDTVMRPGHPDGDLISSRAYSYTDSGDLASIDGATGGVSATASYSYDALHRLRTASGPNGYQGTLTYSPAGNILSASVTWDGSSETRDVRYEYGTRDPQAVDRLVNAVGEDTYARFTYDLAGNMVERTIPEGNWALQWDGLDRIRTVQGPDGVETYYYDHSGMRMLAVDEGHGVRFWFAESETHYDLEGTETRRYLHLSGGGSTLARIENGTEVELQYADALQNLMFSLDAQGNVVASFLYGPFGEVVGATGAEDHRRQFNGKENDVVSGLRYYGYRYYDPLILRWNSADPLYRFVPDLGQTEPQRMNLYTFSLDNPVRYYDPDGRDAGDNPLWRVAIGCYAEAPGCPVGAKKPKEEDKDKNKDTKDQNKKCTGQKCKENEKGSQKKKPTPVERAQEIVDEMARWMARASRMRSYEFERMIEEESQKLMEESGGAVRDYIYRGDVCGYHGCFPQIEEAPYLVVEGQISESQQRKLESIRAAQIMLYQWKAEEKRLYEWGLDIMYWAKTTGTR